VIEKIRAARKKPGLMRQHLSAVLATAEIGGAEMGGAALDSRRLVFSPGPVQAGDYAFRLSCEELATLWHPATATERHRGFERLGTTYGPVHAA
jgi:RNA 3'-terminal phosphate cyclase (ATP)